MEEAYIENSVRTRLIIAGINELEERGVKDFSLRRAALAAQVSCAAPYRHFRDKNEFIAEIVKYIGTRWELLCKEIESVYKEDLHRRIIELAVSNLRFWIANPNYRTVLMTVSLTADESFSFFDEALMGAIDEYCAKFGTDAEIKKYTVRALIYGTLTLVSSTDDRISLSERFRQKMEEEFPLENN